MNWERQEIYLYSMQIYFTVQKRFKSAVEVCLLGKFERYNDFHRRLPRSASRNRRRQRSSAAQKHNLHDTLRCFVLQIDFGVLAGVQRVAAIITRTVARIIARIIDASGTLAEFVGVGVD